MGRVEYAVESVVTAAVLVLGLLIVRGRGLLAEISAGGKREGLIYVLAYVHILLGGAMVFGAGAARVVATALHVADRDDRAPVYAVFIVTSILVTAIVVARMIARARRELG